MVISPSLRIGAGNVPRSTNRALLYELVTASLKAGEVKPAGDSCGRGIANKPNSRHTRRHTPDHPHPADVNPRVNTPVAIPRQSAYPLPITDSGHAGAGDRSRSRLFQLERTCPIGRGSDPDMPGERERIMYGVGHRLKRYSLCQVKAAAAGC
jgi:hypothetical protein